MKKRDLEIALQQIPTPSQFKVEHEQYLTPATIAADILFFAYAQGDIQDKTVIDLGCGTGIFSIGASLLGAKEVTAFDIDNDIIEIAKEYSTTHNLPIEFIQSDVTNVNQPCDTILMNPPFGAQKAHQGADRKFLETATTLADVIYSLHLQTTLPFLEKLLKARDAQITHLISYDFTIKAQHHFHKDLKRNFPVIFLRIVTKKEDKK